MKRSMTFARSKPAPVKGAGGLKSFPKQQVTGLARKPGHRVPKAQKPPPFRKATSGL